MISFQKIVYILPILSFIFSFSNAKQEYIPVYHVQIVNTYPHDETAFTEGLIYKDGFFYESTGPYKAKNSYKDEDKGQSDLRKVELLTGKILDSKSLPETEESEPEFGEGLTSLGEDLYQLTLENHYGYVYIGYNKNNFTFIKKFIQRGQGWGLTNDGTSLIMSNGTRFIRFIDPKTFSITHGLVVKAGNWSVLNINELEWIRGEIWAAIWNTERDSNNNSLIAVINPNTGKVKYYIDLSNLRPDETKDDDNAVFNGIAYDNVKDRIFVTGKFWSKVFEVKVIQ